MRMTSELDSCFQIKKRHALNAICDELRSKYLPLGLDHMLVVNSTEFRRESECYFEESIPIPKIDLNEDLPTVMLLGQTGAGKSYFGNALLGYVDPSKGIFRTRNSHSSTNSIPSFNAVTAGINAQTGSFFQNT